MIPEQLNILEDAINQQAALDLYVRELGLLRAHANWEAEPIDLRTQTMLEQNFVQSSS